jgi:hypothetical protein
VADLDLMAINEVLAGVSLASSRERGIGAKRLCLGGANCIYAQVIKPRPTCWRSARLGGG